MNTIKWLCFTLALFLNVCYCYKIPKSGHSSKKIVGGFINGIWEVAYTGAIELGGLFRCTATLIHVAWLALAGHCLANETQLVIKERGRVRLGSTYRVQGGDLYFILRFVIHPYYQFDKMAYDLGLTQLTVSIKVTENKTPIPLIHPGDYANLTHEVILVSGYGMDKDGPAAVLKSAKLLVMENAKCEDKFSQRDMPTRIKDTMFCTWPFQSSPCLGDAGGPAVYNKKLLGIVTKGGVRCRLPTSPAIYMKIPEFIWWMRAVTKIEL